MIYSYEAMLPNGEIVKLSDYRGKVLLIVNTASECKFTPQLEYLQRMYRHYENDDFEILAFPCNQFGQQEPRSSDEAEEFCKFNYGVTFPVFVKTNVNGDFANPIFQYLKGEKPFREFDESNGYEKMLKLMIAEKSPEWLLGEHIKWNFTKFLIDQEGNVIERYEPTDGMRVIYREIDKLLNKN